MPSLFRSVVKKVGSVWGRLATKGSLGFIPTGSRPSQWFAFNYLALLAFVSVMALLVVGASLSLSKRSERLRELKNLKAIYANYQSEIGKYEEDVQHNKEQFERVSETLRDVFKLFEGTTPSKPLSMPTADAYVSLGPDASGPKRFHVYGEYELDEGFKVPEQMRELNSLRLNVLQTIERLRRVESFVEFESELTRLVPTGWPITNNKGYKTSPFGVRMSPFLGRGAFHTGVDIAASPRTPIVASADGKVAFAGTKTGYGYTVVLQHKFGYRTLYGHNSKLLVKQGQEVKRGQAIALLGNTGRSTGYHLHFEIRINNVPIDPWPYLKD